MTEKEAQERIIQVGNLCLSYGSVIYDLESSNVNYGSVMDDLESINERKAVLLGCRYVDSVIENEGDEDSTID